MNTSSGFHSAVGKKKSKGGGGTKLPPGLTKRMAAKKEDHQPVPDNALSAYGRRRKMKMRGG